MLCCDGCWQHPAQVHTEHMLHSTDGPHTPVPPTESALHTHCCRVNPIHSLAVSHAANACHKWCKRADNGHKACQHHCLASILVIKCLSLLDVLLFQQLFVKCPAACTREGKGRKPYSEGRADSGKKPAESEARTWHAAQAENWERGWAEKIGQSVTSETLQQHTCCCCYLEGCGCFQLHHVGRPAPCKRNASPTMVAVMKGIRQYVCNKHTGLYSNQYCDA